MHRTSNSVSLSWVNSFIPICKSNNIDHIKENIDIFDFRLTDTEMNEMNILNINLRFNDPGKFCLEAFGTHCPIYD